jgi:protein gp37
MSERTGISWTHHTFNPWWGCLRVSPGCENCYAETLSRRYGKDLWGPLAPREPRSEAYWREPLRWAAKASEAGQRRRVFCASMGDVFERRDGDVGAFLDHQRARLWDLIRCTPELDWLLLTKRPENFQDMLPLSHLHVRDARGLPGYAGPWQNLWLGVTAEDQERADRRIPLLLDAPAIVRFVSAEPLLGPLDLRRIGAWRGELLSALEEQVGHVERPRVDWVIVGGESGAGARPMSPRWAEDLRDQAKAAGVAYHFKQWGEWVPEHHPLFVQPHPDDDDDRYACVDSDPARPLGGYVPMARVGAKRAGRELAGRVWDEVPVPCAS